MPRLPLWTVDSFASRPFEGNPAAVVLLPSALPDTLLQGVAAEVGLSETCFLLPLDGRGGARWSLRWFTPTNEVPLCGHGTLASATVLLEELAVAADTLRFATLGGELTAKRAGPGVEMALPRHLGLPPADGRWAGLAEVAACGLPVLEVLHTPALAYLTVVLGDAVTRQQLEAVSPDMEALVGAGTLAGVTVTCRGDSTHHFYSRHFDPWEGIPEDPVTGSAHSILAPYWASKLGLTHMVARQCSRRGGRLELWVEEEVVRVRGEATVVFRGSITLPSLEPWWLASMEQ